MLINIHELSSLASILIKTGLLSTVSSKLESAIVKEHRRVSLCCIIVLSKHMIGYWFFVKGCRLDRILSSQRYRLPSITSLSRFFSFSRFCRERDLLQVHTLRDFNCILNSFCFGQSVLALYSIANISHVKEYERGHMHAYFEDEAQVYRSY